MLLFCKSCVFFFQLALKNSFSLMLWCLKGIFSWLLNSVLCSYTQYIKTNFRSKLRKVVKKKINCCCFFKPDWQNVFCTISFFAEIFCGTYAFGGNNSKWSHHGRKLQLTRPSILCVTHQMNHKKRNYSALPYEIMNYKWYQQVLGQYKAIPAGTWWYWVSINLYCLVLCGTGSA